MFVNPLYSVRELEIDHLSIYHELKVVYVSVAEKSFESRKILLKVALEYELLCPAESPEPPVYLSQDFEVYSHRQSVNRKRLAVPI